MHQVSFDRLQFTTPAKIKQGKGGGGGKKDETIKRQEKNNKEIFMLFYIGLSPVCFTHFFLLLI